MTRLSRYQSATAGLGRQLFALNGAIKSVGEIHVQLRHAPTIVRPQHDPQIVVANLTNRMVIEPVNVVSCRVKDVKRFVIRNVVATLQPFSRRSPARV